MTPEERFGLLKDAERWDLGPEPEPGHVGATRRSGTRRTAAITAVVAVVVVVLSAIAVAGPWTHRGAPAGRGAELVHRLPPLGGTGLALWTSDEPGPLASGPYDASGSALIFVWVCQGNGSLRWSVPGHRDTVIPCGAAIGSGELAYSKAGADVVETAPVSVRVSTTGSPAFALRLVATRPESTTSSSRTARIAATGPGVPASLRSCTAADFAPMAALTLSARTAIGYASVVSVASSDCAVRRWPDLNYLTASGARIGTVADEIDGGTAPTRVRAGSTVYVEVDVFGSRLLADPECAADRVAALVLTLGDGGSIRLPIPADRPSAACTNPLDHASGVGRVLTARPTG